MTKFRIGDIVIIRATFLGEPENTHAYVYEEYNLPGGSNDWGWDGVSIITENGVNLGGFSKDEQDKYLDFVRKSGVDYVFANVIKLERDFPTKIKPVFKV